MGIVKHLVVENIATWLPLKDLFCNQEIKFDIDFIELHSTQTLFKTFDLTLDECNL